MKNQLKVILATLAVTSLSLSAQAANIATWTFETVTAPTGGSAAYPNPIAADIGSGNATGVHASASTVWSTPVGNGSAKSFSSTNWSVGDYYQFNVSTTGYTGITLAWDQAGSNTGPRDFTLSYSTDGISFTNFANYSVLANAAPNATWSSTTAHSEYSLTQDLSSVSALNNQAQLYFRLTDRSTVSANGGAVGTGGTDRVDNFSVSGVAAVPVPAAAWLMGSSLLGLAGIARKRRNA